MCRILLWGNGYIYSQYEYIYTQTTKCQENHRMCCESVDIFEEFSYKETHDQMQTPTPYVR